MIVDIFLFFIGKQSMVVMINMLNRSKELIRKGYEKQANTRILVKAPP